MTVVKVILALALSYLIGSFQPSYIFGKLIKKVDIRDYGSGNPGATNAIRVFGVKFGMMCLIIDALKGALAVLIVKFLFGPEWIQLQLAAGIAAIFGHNYPFYMGFKGGKGVAATLGIILMVDWRVFVLAGTPAILILLITRIMSVASLTFQFLTLVFFIFFNITNDSLISIAVTAALYPLISFWRHRQNISRLIAGEEPKLWGKGSKKITLETAVAEDEEEDKMFDDEITENE